MMKKFVSQLKKKNYAQGEKLESEALIVAQKLLVNMGLDFIPQSYANFMKYFNGIKGNGSYLFGATVDDDLDIADKNLQMQKPFRTIVLGYNEFDLLVYNYDVKLYQIIDRDDFKVLDCYKDNEISLALNHIFNV